MTNIDGSVGSVFGVSVKIKKREEIRGVKQYTRVIKMEDLEKVGEEVHPTGVDSEVGKFRQNKVIKGFTKP